MNKSRDRARSAANEGCAVSPCDLSSGVEVQRSHWLQHLHAAHVLPRKQEANISVRHFLHHSPIAQGVHSREREQCSPCLTFMSVVLHNKMYNRSESERKCFEQQKGIYIGQWGCSKSVSVTYPYSVGNTRGADHTVRVQPAAGGFVDKGAMTRPLVSSQLPSFHPCPPGRPSQPVHVLQRRSGRGRRSS